MITQETATDIALAYRDIKIASELLEEVQKAILNNNGDSDVRDAFGRRVGGLQLGVPSGRDSQRLFNLDWELAKPIIQAHIAKTKAKIEALNQKALAEGAIQ